MRLVQNIRLRRLALWAGVICAVGSGRLHANDVRELVQPSLLAEPSAATPGIPFTAAVRLRVPEGWHLAWQNPGDAGLPPSLRWELPAQVAAAAPSAAMAAAPRLPD